MMAYNEPAFPVQDCAAFQYSGMSLRDWFAGQALTAAWSARDGGYYDGNDHDMARCAYQIADAMMEARK